MLVLAVAAVALGACGDSTPTTIDRRPTMTLSPVHDSLFFGRTRKLLPVVSDESGFSILSSNKWSSSDTTVARVDSVGNVTGVGMGRAKITVEREGRSASTDIRVMLMDLDNGVALEQGSAAELSTALCASGDGRMFCRNWTATTDTTPMFVAMPGVGNAGVSYGFASFHNVCALRTDGRVLCWGRNAHFTFGTRDPLASEAEPIVAKTGVQFSLLAHNGHSQSCGINRVDSVAYCWGHNDAYQLARGELTGSDSIVAPMQPRMKAKRIFTSNFATCITDLNDVAHCAGGGEWDQSWLGIAPSTEPAKELMPIASGRRYTAMSFGSRFMCAIDVSQDAFCWGNNEQGQLGVGYTSRIGVGPQSVVGGIKFKSIASGGSFVCGVALDGDVYCWGAFPPGVVSSRLGTRAYQPSLVLKGVKATHIFSNGRTCIHTETRQTNCW